MAQADSMVYLRKIDITTWGTEVTREYNVNYVPNIRVFTPGGRQAGEETSRAAATRQLIERAKGM